MAKKKIINKLYNGIFDKMDVNQAEEYFERARGKYQEQLDKFDKLYELYKKPNTNGEYDKKWKKKKKKKKIKVVLGKIIVINPVGEGKYFRGKYEPDKNYPLYVQSIRCQFEVKEGFLPTIQIKHSLSFMSTEYLTSSNGEETNLILTSIDLKLFLDHYNVYDMEYIDGWKFQQADGIFRDYIDKWSTNKIQAKKDGNHGLYTISKLFLNSLYGKFATRIEAVSKAPTLDDEGIVHYKLLEPETKKGVYIPVGVFVTSYARNVTIRSAQKVFDRFVYADTDSLHLIGTELPEGLVIDDTKLGAWKHESTFCRARFIRAKTYIEDEDGVLNVKACGLPEKCHEQVTWENFHPGAVYTGKLLPRHVPGGIVLEDKNFTISI